MMSFKNPYASRMHNPAHPGLVLKEWIPEEVTVTEAALQLGVTRAMLSKILNQKAAQGYRRYSRSCERRERRWRGQH